MLEQDDFVLTAEEEGLQFILHELLFRNLDGAFFTIKQAQGIVAHYEHFSMVVVGNKIGFLTGVEDINTHVEHCNENDYMVFAKPEIGIAEPGNKNKCNNGKGKHDGQE